MRGGGNIMKRIIGIIVFILLIFTILPASANINIDRTYDSTIIGNSFYVGGSRPGNYTSIKEATNESSRYDTLYPIR